MFGHLRILAALLLIATALAACAGRGDREAERAIAEASQEAQDDTACRSADVEPDSEAYKVCRQRLAADRARQAEIDYQKARDFDRVLGGLDNL